MHPDKLLDKISTLATELGFAKIGIADPNVVPHQDHFDNWLQQNFQANMHFMQNHKEKRFDPKQLMASTKSIICASLPYEKCEPNKLSDNWKQNHAIATYATKVDYHKVMIEKLHALATRISDCFENFMYRAYCDSAPVMEKTLAAQAGIGWIGKNTCLLTKSGSHFFLGELFTNLELPFTTKYQNHCASCNKCITACPTRALQSPYTLNANLCISYLTLEHKTAIPVKLRKLIGQRIIGCDECQKNCPYNKTRYENLKLIDKKECSEKLITLFNWSKTEFLKKTKNTVIKRVGYERWLRNIAIALGNSPYNKKIIDAFDEQLAKNHSPMVTEHIQWAKDQQQKSQHK